MEGSERKKSGPAILAMFNVYLLANNYMVIELITEQFYVWLYGKEESSPTVRTLQPKKYINTNIPRQLSVLRRML